MWVHLQGCTPMGAPPSQAHLSKMVRTRSWPLTAEMSGGRWNSAPIDGCTLNPKPCTGPVQGYGSRGPDVFPDTGCTRKWHADGNVPRSRSAPVEDGANAQLTLDRRDERRALEERAAQENLKNGRVDEDTLCLPQASGVY